MNNPLTWYFHASQKQVLELNYTSTQNFTLLLLTNDSLPIIVNFGDGVANSISSNVVFSYNMGSVVSGTVKISTPNRLTTISTPNGTNMGWNFSLGTLLVCKNLTNILLRSGNVFGDFVNLSRVLIQADISGTSSGTLTGLPEDMPPTLQTFTMASSASNFQHTIAGVGTYLVNLKRYVLTSNVLSKLTGNIALFPASVNYIDVRNTATNLSQVSYNNSSGSKTWASSMNIVRIRCATGQGLTTAQLDAILIDLNNTTWVSSGGIIELTTGHGTRSSASNAAVTNLSTVRNVTLTLNS